MIQLHDGVVAERAYDYHLTRYMGSFMIREYPTRKDAPGGCNQ